jgi:hypothetical protein
VCVSVVVMRVGVKVPCGHGPCTTFQIVPAHPAHKDGEGYGAQNGR